MYNEFYSFIFKGHHMLTMYVNMQSIAYENSLNVQIYH